MQNNFILQVNDSNPNDVKIEICLNFGGGFVTEFQDLSKTAFAKHPKATFCSNFIDYSDAKFYKDKWIAFLEIYLKKNEETSQQNRNLN